jgi:hypothetical protein
MRDKLGPPGPGPRRPRDASCQPRHPCDVAVYAIRAIRGEAAQQRHLPECRGHTGLERQRPARPARRGSRCRKPRDQAHGHGRDTHDSGHTVLERTPAWPCAKRPLPILGRSFPASTQTSMWWRSRRRPLKSRARLGRTRRGPEVAPFHKFETLHGCGRLSRTNVIHLPAQAVADRA